MNVLNGFQRNEFKFLLSEYVFLKIRKLLTRIIFILVSFVDNFIANNFFYDIFKGNNATDFLHFCTRLISNNIFRHQR